MALTPTGVLWQVTGVQLLVAACATFQSLTKSSSAEEAKRHVHKFAAIDRLHPVPRATVTNEGWEFRKDTRNSFIPSGHVTLTFEFSPPADVAALGVDEMSSWFEIQVESILAEMAALEGTGEPVAGRTHITVERIRQLEFNYERPGDREIELARSGRWPALLWFAVFAVEFSK